mgnify:CR=1 FL=1
MFSLFLGGSVGQTGGGSGVSFLVELLALEQPLFHEGVGVLGLGYQDVDH